MSAPTPAAEPASMSVPENRRTLGMVLVAIYFAGTAVLQLMAGKAIYSDVMPAVAVATDDFMGLVKLFGPLFGTALLNLAAGVCVFLGRREALLFMGCLLGLLLKRLCQLEWTLFGVLDAPIVAGMVYASFRLARSGKLR